MTDSSAAQRVFSPAERVAILPPNFWSEMDAAIARLAAQPGPRVIDVSKGNPDTPTPEHIVAAMQAQVAEPRNHRYPSYEARPSLRQAVAERYRVDHGVTVDPETEVAVFHGSHEAILASVQALADPGSTVVLPDPGYPLYRSAASLAQAHVAPLVLRHPEYAPDWSSISEVKDARMLLLNYPNNPTGALATTRIFSEALDFAAATGAAFIHDFAYSSLGFNGQTPLSALAVDTQLRATVELQTLSKTYSMAGWRCGMAAGNASIIDAMKAFQRHAYSTMFGALQETAAVALSANQDAAHELVTVYQRRRDQVVAALRQLGWDVVQPEGTFFVWARVPYGGDAIDFANRLREEQRVAVAPGDGFGSQGRGHIRIGLVHDEETLAEMLQRLADFTGPSVASGAVV
ncbi:aminotransferase class I/II-fold pyridoxal phosphate-dependent enzyme [Microbacterium sp. YY-01]|uniref:aminotransferase class I/II-fold pyridoxal phosphate-dependent enzyme n=1 Tax=Microbacterium sp. YY-01 TaxID=3421634 RepID=UPI003D17C91B